MALGVHPRKTNERVAIVSEHNANISFHKNFLLNIRWRLGWRRGNKKLASCTEYLTFLYKGCDKSDPNLHSLNPTGPASH